jgi:anti-sigma factor RsiW
MSLDDRVAGVSCREVLAQLGEYQDGGLDAGARAALEAHVTACDRCAAFGGAYGGLVAQLRERLAPPTLDRARAERLAARLASEP